MTPAWLDEPWRRSHNKRKARIIVAVASALVLIVLAVTLTAESQVSVPLLRQGTFHPDSRYRVEAKHAAVASDVDECSQMGVDVLKNGGNAADAAVTVALCIGSVNFQSSGIGGGGFITVRHPNGTAYVIDCRETAPKAAKKHMFKDNPRRSQIGGLAAGVPGELAGLQKLFDLSGSGKQKWEDLVEPVIDMNEYGFSASASVVGAYMILQRNGVALDMGGWDWFLPHGPHTSVAGIPKIITRPNLAKTLRKIAKGGAQAFYDPEGDIAPHLVAILRATGGIMEVEDFADYEVVLRQPLNTTFFGRQVFTSPAPTSGPALILGLHVIEELLGDDSTDLSEVDTQRLIETLKWMAAARSELGDPAFVDNPNIDKIVQPQWANNVRGNISDKHTLKSWKDYHPSYEMNDPHGTAHFSIVDRDGMAVSMTTTVNLLFGNMVADPITGIVLNSEMDDFSQPDNQNFFELAPSVYNFIEPGKRPLSSTVPTIIVKDGQPELVIGAAGGSRIVTAVFQAIVRIYGYKMPLLETIAYPRLHHQLIPYKVSSEPLMPANVLKSLKKKKHEVAVQNAASTMNGILSVDGGYHAVSDHWRKRGMAAGY